MKILKYLFKGMLFGCTTYAITMLIGFLAVGNSIIFADATQNAISIICYIITCIGFFVPSVIYENEKLVLPVRIIIHMGIGYIAVSYTHLDVYKRQSLHRLKSLYMTWHILKIVQ